MHYVGCEKIARGIVGIQTQRPAEVVYRHNFKLQLKDIKAAATSLNLPVTPHDLEWLFADYNEQSLLKSYALGFSKSARYLRNRLMHDFGPTHLWQVSQHAPFLNAKLETLLRTTPTILAYLRSKFSEVP